MDEQEFCEWYGEVLGYGYGTGDVHYCNNLRHFFWLAAQPGPYDYNEMERDMGAAVFWLLLNTLCNAGVVDYGTSPRAGWLSPEGRRIADFVNGYEGSLYDLVMSVYSD